MQSYFASTVAARPPSLITDFRIIYNSLAMLHIAWANQSKEIVVAQFS